MRLTDVALQLPRAPEAAEAQAEAARQRGAAAAKAGYEAAVAAVRELRMALRDVATRLLCDRRWRSLALPVAPQDDPEYWERVSINPHSNLLGQGGCLAWVLRVALPDCLLPQAWQGYCMSGLFLTAKSNDRSLCRNPTYAHGGSGMRTLHILM